MYSQLGYVRADRLHVTCQTVFQPFDACGNHGAHLGIGQAF